MVALGGRRDGSALTDAEVAAVLDLGRRMVIEGLASPAVREPGGMLQTSIRAVAIDG